VLRIHERYLVFAQPSQKVVLKRETKRHYGGSHKISEAKDSNDQSSRREEGLPRLYITWVIPLGVSSQIQPPHPEPAVDHDNKDGFLAGVKSPLALPVKDARWQ
jgi:hypothetical protein